MKSTGRYYRHYKGDYYEALSFNGVDDKGLGAVVYIPLYESEHSFFTQRLVRFAGATVYNGNVVERFTEVSYDDLPKFARHFVTVRHLPAGVAGWAVGDISDEVDPIRLDNGGYHP